MGLRTIIGCTLGVLVLVAAVLHAKDVVGVYCLPDKVVFEPNATGPERVQIWGSFLIADRATPTAYLPVERGYVYYACPSGRQTTCRQEWSDVQSAAGKGQGIGFGSRFQANGRVRKLTDKVESPDPYPMQFGTVHLGPDAHSTELLAELKAAK